MTNLHKQRLEELRSPYKEHGYLLYYFWLSDEKELESMFPDIDKLIYNVIKNEIYSSKYCVFLTVDEYIRYVPHEMNDEDCTLFKLEYG